MPIKIIADKCSACGKCVNACPFEVIEIKSREETGQPHPRFKNIAVINPGCNLCGACPPVCPFDAIELIKEEKKAKVPLKDYKDIWVFAEQKEGEIEEVGLELLGKGRELANKRDCLLAAVLMGGKGIKEKAAQLISRGADRVYVMEDEALKDFLDEPYAEALCYLIDKYKPEVVLMGATTIGRAFASRVAARMPAGLTADCTELDIDPDCGLLYQTRPAFGGNIMATIFAEHHRPQMATVRHKVFKPLEKDKSRKGEVKEEKYPGKFTSRSKIVKSIKDETQQVNLADADIIV
ncbi:MAG: 4Fe-4S dicluster domain-containing protein, partial [Elusimicrobiota bacterium]